MLVIYNDQGAIEQTVIIGDFESLTPIFVAMGKHVLSVDEIGSPEKCYVLNGKVVAMPNIEIIGEVRAIKADGVDTLTFSINPQSFDLTVMLGNTVVHQESSSAGSLEFAVTHPGTYKLTFLAAFPYYPTSLVLEAQ